MNKKLYAVYMMLLFVATTAVRDTNALGARKKTVAKETPAMQVNREISTIDQIVEQAKMIIEASGPNAHKTRATAKSQVNKLMKELEPHIKEAIKEDIKIILGATASNKNEVRNAYDRLIATINVINAQADVINALDNANTAIKQAPVGMKEQVIAEQVHNIQAAEAKAEEVGIMGRMIGGVKSTLAAPGNYFFGEQRTALKTAVEATVGTLAIAGTAYLAYVYAPEGTKAKLGEYISKARETFFGKKAETTQAIQDEKGTIIAVKDEKGNTILPGDPRFFKLRKKALEEMGGKKPAVYSLEEIGQAAKTIGKRSLVAPIQEPTEFEPGLPEELRTAEERKTLQETAKALKEQGLNWANQMSPKTQKRLRFFTGEVPVGEEFTAEEMKKHPFRTQIKETAAPYIQKAEEYTAPHIEKAKEKWEAFKKPSEEPPAPITIATPPAYKPLTPEEKIAIENKVNLTTAEIENLDSQLERGGTQEDMDKVKAQLTEKRDVLNRLTQILNQ